MNTRVAGIAIGLCLAAAVSMTAAGVKVANNEKIDFSGFKTYDWKPGMQAPSQLTEKRIHRAVDEQLKAKGFTRTSDSPDVYVISHASGTSTGRLDVNGFGYAGYGWTGWQDFGPLVTSVRDNSKGSLIVDILDGKSSDLIWRAVADENLGADPNPEKIGKKVFKIVEKMFDDFPPKMKGGK
jgi:uncharacterized protein DUF4136